MCTYLRGGPGRLVHPYAASHGSTLDLQSITSERVELALKWASGHCRCKPMYCLPMVVEEVQNAVMYALAFLAKWRNFSQGLPLSAHPALLPKAPSELNCIPHFGLP